MIKKKAKKRIEREGGRKRTVWEGALKLEEKSKVKCRICIKVRREN